MLQTSQGARIGDAMTGSAPGRDAPKSATRSSELEPRRSPGEVVAAHDGTDRGDDAVALAALLAGGYSGVRVAMVVPLAGEEFGDPAQPLPGAETWDERCAARRAAGARMLEERVGSLVGARREPLVGDATVATLAALCDRVGAASVVTGSTRRAALGRVLLGGTWERLARSVRCPVGVAPAGFAATERQLRTIVVAFDGGPEACRALDYAVGLARGRGAGLRVVGVVERGLGQLAAAEQAMDALAGELPADPAGALRERAERAMVPGVPAEIDIRRGGPAEELLAACSRDVDLLVAGSRGHGPAARVLLSSVTSRLTRSAPCPVLVVPRGE